MPNIIFNIYINYPVAILCKFVFLVDHLIVFSIGEFLPESRGACPKMGVSNLNLNQDKLCIF